MNDCTFQPLLQVWVLIKTKAHPVAGMSLKVILMEGYYPSNSIFMFWIYAAFKTVVLFLTLGLVKV
jgi:hypothetical protein